MSKKIRHQRILHALMASQWAITEDYLRTMLAVVNRETDVRAIERELGYQLENTHAVTIKNGVARIPVTGPMFRYANLFVQVSGATAYEVLATDLGTAMADPSIRAVVLEIDSPGGEVNGCAELAGLVASFRGVKPIIAYVSGMGCSAAYWLAAAADQIVAHETAIVGSIGVLFSVVDHSAQDEANGLREITIVSSQSPNKRLDPATDAGRARVQAVADSLADVFITRVAEYRGVSVETVLEDYGQGGVFVGAEAMDAGLIDGLGTLESVELALSAGELPVAPRPNREPAMAEDQTKDQQTDDEEQDKTVAEDQPTDTKPEDEDEEKDDETPADPVAKAVAAERKRIVGIHALIKPGLEGLAAKAEADGWSVEVFAEAAKAVEAARGRSHLASLKADEARLDAPDGAPGGEQQDTESAHAVSQRILAAHQAAHPHRA